MRRTFPCILAVIVVMGCSRRRVTPSQHLAVVAEIPPAGSVDVDVNQTVAVVFATSVDPASVTRDALQVADGAGSLPGTSAYDPATRVLTWTPNGEMPRGAVVSAQVAASLRGTNGATFAGFVWSFAIRAGVPATPQLIASSVPQQPPFIVMHRDGTALVATGMQSWEWRMSGVGPAATVPGGIVRGLELDSNDAAAAVTVPPGGGTFVDLSVTRRSLAGSWTQPKVAVNTGNLVFVGASLHGNEQGDLLLHWYGGLTSPTRVLDFVLWSAGRDAGAPWLSVPVAFSAQWFGLRVALDGAGRVATLHAQRPDGILAERHDASTRTRETFTVSPTGTAALFIGGDAQGGLRAIWNDAAGAMASRFVRGTGFGAPTLVAASSAPDKFSMSATGAVVGAYLEGGAVVVCRSEAGSDQWSRARMGPGAQQLLVVEMSRRGEAVLLWDRLAGATFELWLGRWRAGMVPDEPKLLAMVPLPLSVRGAAAVTNGAGRILAAYQVAADNQTPAAVWGVRIE